MKKLFLYNIFNYIIIYVLLINQIKSQEDYNFYDFLENKTPDHLRQIFLSIKNILSLNEKQLSKMNYYTVLSSIWTATNIGTIKNKILVFLKDEIRLEDDWPIFKNSIADNQYFKIETTEKINKLIEENENKLPINYLINFAFNIDKYDRTQKEEINSVSDYIKFFTRDRIKKFIYEKLNEYPELYDPQNFTEIVLNNILFKYKDTKSYIAGKSKKELIQFMYGFEKYCFNSNKSVEEDCTLAYNLYRHENFESYSINELDNKLSTYYKKTNLDNDVYKFIFLIENRGFTYLNKENIIKKFDIDQLNKNVKAFETYYKRQTNTQDSLDNLEEYIKAIPVKRKKEILEWALDLYPELGEKGRLEDITSSETYLQFGKVKLFVKVTNRDELLKYAYNIHTFHNNITSIYDDDLYDFIRMNDNLLYDKIFKSANKNILLQDKKKFTYYASLYKDQYEEYIKHLQRNQLKILTSGLIQLYYDNQMIRGNAESFKYPSQRRELIDSIEKLTNEDLLSKVKDYKDYLTINETFDIFNQDNEEKRYITKYFDYFENIMDFFRSTDINYLRIWLRKYEIIIRKQKSEIFLMGGLKTNYMNINEYTKQELLKKFDIYINEYPELFTPENFIKIVGLDKGITPHKFLVENADNLEIIGKVTSSIIGHFQLKNIQTNFNDLGFLSIVLMKEFTIEDYNNNTNNNNIIKDRYLYQLFRLINIFPELNNMEIFNITCIDDNTRILSINDLNDETFDKINNQHPEKLLEMKNNIKQYLKIRNIEEIKTATDLDFVKKFYYANDIISNEANRLRILYGDLYPVIYDFSIYIDDLNDIIINNIYNILQKEEKIENISDTLLSIEEKKEIIINASNKYEELQNPTFFDTHYNYLNFSSEYPDMSDELYKLLNKSTTKNIFYYCLITNILKIKYIANDNDNNNGYSGNPGDIYLNIRYMSRVSMIRYILDVVKFNGKLREIITPENLPKLVKYYMLDIGSDNIYDLTLY